LAKKQVEVLEVKLFKESTAEYFMRCIPMLFARQAYEHRKETIFPTIKEVSGKRTAALLVANCCKFRVASGIDGVRPSVFREQNRAFELYGEFVGMMEGKRRIWSAAKQINIQEPTKVRPIDVYTCEDQFFLYCLLARIVPAVERLIDDAYRQTRIMFVGGRPGFSTFDAAFAWFEACKYPEDPQVVGSDDIANFFPSVRHVDVKAMLSRSGVSDQTWRHIRDHITESKSRSVDLVKGVGLPMGSTLSPMLAVGTLAHVVLSSGFVCPKGVLITSYVDDITFISNSLLMYSEARSDLRHVLRDHGLDLKEAKHQVARKGDGMRCKSLGWYLSLKCRVGRRANKLRLSPPKGWLGFRDVVRAFRSGKFVLAQSILHGRCNYQRLTGAPQLWSYMNFRKALQHLVGGTVLARGRGRLSLTAANMLMHVTKLSRRKLKPRLLSILAPSQDIVD